MRSAWPGCSRRSPRSSSTGIEALFPSHPDRESGSQPRGSRLALAHGRRDRRRDECGGWGRCRRGRPFGRGLRRGCPLGRRRRRGRCHRGVLRPFSRAPGTSSSSGSMPRDQRESDVARRPTADPGRRRPGRFIGRLVGEGPAVRQRAVTAALEAVALAIERIAATAQGPDSALAARDAKSGIAAELAISRIQQRSTVSLEPPEVAGYDLASYEPAREIGGDFFELFRLRRRGRPLGVDRRCHRQGHRRGAADGVRQYQSSTRRCRLPGPRRRASAHQPDPRRRAAHRPVHHRAGGSVGRRERTDRHRQCRSRTAVADPGGRRT